MCAAMAGSSTEIGKLDTLTAVMLVDDVLLELTANCFAARRGSVGTTSD